VKTLGLFNDALSTTEVMYNNWQLALVVSLTANILNKQSRTADKGWASSLGVGREANKPSS
jgi:hypothetical protein